MDSQDAIVNYTYDYKTMQQSSTYIYLINDEHGSCSLTSLDYIERMEDEEDAEELKAMLEEGIEFEDCDDYIEQRLCSIKLGTPLKPKKKY